MPEVLEDTPGLINKIPIGGTMPVTTYNPATAAPKVATATGYETSPFTVTPEQTTAEQIRRVIGENSPLLQKAEARAKQYANDRGLLNTSIAVGEGQKALYDAALPIASADAAVYERAGTNTNNALLASRAFEAGAKNTAENLNASLGTDVNKTNAAAENAQLAQGADTALRQLLQTSDNETKTLLQSMSDKAAFSRSQLTAETQLAIAKIDNETKQALAQLDADNRKLLQTSSSLSQMYQETVKNIAAIAVNDTMTASAKQTATQSQMALLNEGLKTAAAVAATDQAALASLQLGDFFVSTQPAEQQQALAGVNPQAILNADRDAVMAAIRVLGRDEWDGLLNVFERGAPFSSGTTQQLGLLAEEVQKAQA